MDERDLLPDYVFTSLRRVNGHTYSGNSEYLHLIIEFIYRGKRFFNAKMYRATELIMHIPLPLQAVLCASLKPYEGLAVTVKQHKYTRIYGLLCTPNYENRIVISHPASAFLLNEPLVVIELDETNYPTYFELN